MTQDPNFENQILQLKALTSSKYVSTYDYRKIYSILKGLSYAQLSELVKEHKIVSLDQIKRSLDYGNGENEHGNILRFLFTEGYDLRANALPVSLSNIKLEELKLALDKGLNPGYVVKRSGDIYSIGRSNVIKTKLQFVSAAVEYGYKLEDLDWNKIISYSYWLRQIEDDEDIRIDVWLSAVKADLLTFKELSEKIKSSQRKLDFLSAISPEELNKINPNIFIGISIEHIKTYLEKGLTIASLTLALPELFKEAPSKSDLLRLFIDKGVPKDFIQDNIPATLWEHLDLESLQLLLDNNIKPEEIARRIIKAMEHYGVDYKETLHNHLKFLSPKGLDLSQLEEGYNLPMAVLEIYKEIFINKLSASKMLERALTATVTARVYTKGEQVDQTKLLSQKNVITKSIAQGADITTVLNNIISTYKASCISLETIELNKGLLIKSATNFLKLVLSKQLDECKSYLLEDALNAGADVNSVFTTSSDLEILYAHRNLLLYHQNSLSAQKFLELALKADVRSYDRSLQKYITDYVHKIEKQRELISMAILKGANVDMAFKAVSEVSFDILEYNKDILLTKESATSFFKLVWNKEVDNDSFECKQELLEYAIDRGASVVTALKDVYVNIKTLYLFRDLLLDEKQSFPIEKFLSLVLQANTQSYDSNARQHVADAEKIELQKKLLKAVLDKNIDVGAILLKSYVGLETLVENKDLFFEHPKVSADTILELALRVDVTNYDSDLGKSVIVPEKLISQKLFIKTALDRRADLKLVFDHYLRIEQLIEYESMLVRNDTVELYLKSFARALRSLEEKSQEEWSTVEKTTELETHLVYIINKYQSHLSDITKQVLLASATENLFHYFTKDLGWSIDCGVTKNWLEKELLKEINGAVRGEVSRNPQLLIDYKYRNLHAVESNQLKIPTVLHHIWLTAPDKINQIRKQDIENAKRTQELLKKSGKQPWTQIIWVNHKDLLQPSIKAFEGTGITIRDIGEIKQQLVNYDVIVREINLHHWGTASDTLRLGLVSIFGGVYADINYIFSKVPDYESRTYDFLSATYSLSYHFSIDNFIFGAKPHHPVIECAQKMVRQNLVDPSPELKELYNSSISDFTDKTADTFGYCFFNAAHKDCNIDVVYPKPTEMRDDGTILEFDIVHPTKSAPSILEKNILNNMLLYCPDIHKVLLERKQQGYEYEKYLYDHELCAVPNKTVIGHDSHDGGTWI
jgi:hypothetical protein